MLQKQIEFSPDFVRTQIGNAKKEETESQNAVSGYN